MEHPLLLILHALVVGYLPGALIFRLPWWERDRRAALASDERVFWHVTLSLAWSLTAVLVLAALEQYRFDRLVLINVAMIALLVLAGRQRLLYGGRAARPAWTIILPVVLVLLGLWRFFPSSEYIIGGKDPGTYMNEGIQIAQRGALTIHDPDVAAVPTSSRELFFPFYKQAGYYSLRFMGFFLRDADRPDVNGQFPQLFPIAIAAGYGLDGLTGARMTTGVLGILGLLAVYFLGARLIGRTAAVAGAILLSLNVAEVWFARYPNSELEMQVLLFAALLAFARAHQDNDRFFGPVAAVLAGLMLFARIEAIPVMAGLLATLVLAWLVEYRRPRVGFLLMLAPWFIGVGFYFAGPIRPYMLRAPAALASLPPRGVATAVISGILVFAVMVSLRRRFADRARRGVPIAVAMLVMAATTYAAFFREPGGRLDEADAHAFRAFTSLYLLWPGLAAALVGFVLVTRRSFWRDPAFILIFSGFAFFFFYKTQIVPLEFWASRRFLPVILPAALLFVGAAAFGASDTSWSRGQVARRLVGAVFLVFLGHQYSANAAPVMPHVEYAGMIPYLERLAGQFGDHDLVLVESRNAGSDTHVLAVPLAYIYARHVLVLNSPRPDKAQLHAFIENALTKYSRVFFVGGGGTDLLSRHVAATATADESVKVPEFEEVASTAYVLPRAIKRKDFDYSVYRLSLTTGAAAPFVLDVGYRDDLNVLRFNAKETTEGRTIRWTGRQSFVSVPGMSGHEREVTLVMSDGGRPKAAVLAHVNVSLNGVALGGADVGPAFHPYTFAIPPAVATAAAIADDPAQLTLVSSVWIPQQLLGGADDRTLGVMVDRVEVR